MKYSKDSALKYSYLARWIDRVILFFIRRSMLPLWNTLLMLDLSNDHYCRPQHTHTGVNGSEGWRKTARRRITCKWHSRRVFVNVSRYQDADTNNMRSDRAVVFVCEGYQEDSDCSLWQKDTPTDINKNWFPIILKMNRQEPETWSSCTANTAV